MLYYNIFGLCTWEIKIKIRFQRYFFFYRKIEFLKHFALWQQIIIWLLPLHICTCGVGGHKSKIFLYKSVLKWTNAIQNWRTNWVQKWFVVIKQKNYKIQVYCKKQLSWNSNVNFDVLPPISTSPIFKSYILFLKEKDSTASPICYPFFFFFIFYLDK